MCFSCVYLHLGEAFCILSCHDLFLCWCCSFLTHHNLFCFISLDTLLGNFLVVVLSAYVCFLASLCIFLFASCHVMTCFFVDVVDFPLMATLFVLFH